MQHALEKELLHIVRAIAFPGPGAVTLAGRTAVNAGAFGPVAGVAMPPNPLIGQLQRLLYDWCYCRRFDEASADATATSAPVADAGFVEPISAANTSRARWDSGWQILQTLPSGQIVAAKGATIRMVWPGEFLAHGPPGVPPRPGAEISLFAPKESRTMQPGFYFAFGETLTDQEDDFAIVRLYWNIEASSVAHLVASLTGSLNRMAVPFRFKCLDKPEFYDRTDAAILYVAKRYYRVVAHLMAEVYPTLRPLLRPATPLFSKRLADGLGFAEDPKSGESFGMNRCRLIAEAICDAHERGIDAEEALLSEVADGFRRAGLSLAHPYLNPGSVDRYGFAQSAFA